MPANTSNAAAAAAADPTLHHPRILCLHGGGVNGETFQLQSRALIAALAPHFRLVFADAPFLCDAGPGIAPVYADLGPFRRWLRWRPEQARVDADAAVDEIWYQLRLAMGADDARGARGDWVGLLGFSQGAKLAASLAFEQQVREERALGVGAGAGVRWRFAVLLAGRAPLVSLSEATRGNVALVSAADISEGVEKIDVPEGEEVRHVLRLPTVHVHGLLDPGLPLHRRLLLQYCHPETAAVVEWEGDHRVPIKRDDVKKVTDAMLAVARRTGVITEEDGWGM